MTYTPKVDREGLLPVANATYVNCCYGGDISCSKLTRFPRLGEG